jgi:hypothetical protein
MRETKLLETFLLKTNSMDNCAVVIGGICTEGKKQEAIEIFLQIKNFSLGKSKDEFLTDVILADSLKKLSPEWIAVLGASIQVEGIEKDSGGIIGNPFEENQSSDEEIEEVYPGLYMLAMPGGPGVVFKGSYSDSLKVKDFIVDRKEKGILCNEDIISKLNTFTNLYMVVYDGSGSSSNGGIYVSDNSGKYFEII